MSASCGTPDHSFDIAATSESAMLPKIIVLQQQTYYQIQARGLSLYGDLRESCGIN
ncbi:hypothetical protein GCM10008090_12640 [Arenicella chitinivorans]|uniref:Uncharacterized protein n=1 Tax=Arenicella chitinivorans TaxID=1329800 RepID=A0A918RM84_9GAMM|nr:hypothetical protein GCM10008090_12640 [Arenicella chitinivorans]